MINNSKISNIELREKIRKGLDLAFKKLVAQKKRNNGVFVFSKNGKIVKIKAINIQD